MNYALSRFSLVFLLIIGSLGVIMRSFPFFDIHFTYQHLLHAHSHVAFQGWIYTILFLLICKYFLTKEQIVQGYYKVQLQLTFLIIVGIFISFLFQGYALYSILFSTLFQFLNYWFIYVLFRDLKANYSKLQKSVSVLFIKMSLWLGLLSTLGPWLIAILSVTGNNGTEVYHSAIYFFMHFQYHGWFYFGAFGILFKLIEQGFSPKQEKWARKFFWLNGIAVFPAYCLSLTGMSFGTFMFPLGFIAAGIQLVCVFYFILLIRAQLNFELLYRKASRPFLKLAFFTFIIKVIVSFGALLPSIEINTFYNRYSIMFYLHLILLGMLTSFFFAIMQYSNWFKQGLALNVGTFFFILGFVGSEIILMMASFGVIKSLMLLLFSTLLVVGVFILIIAGLKQNSIDYKEEAFQSMEGFDKE